MPLIKITVGEHVFKARLEEEKAPKTCAAFLQRLPLSARLIQARWSGEAGWVPLGAADFGVGYENATSYPAPGQILLYPGGLSETERLFPYGSTMFASKVGQLAGNHFLTIVQGQERLEGAGKMILWDGAQNIRFETTGE